MRLIRPWLWLAASLLLVRVALADVPLVYATLQPNKIRMGDSAILTITNLGNGPAQFALPQVKGLQFEVLGQRQQIEMTSGTSLSSTATVIRVTPQSAGVFSIPPPGQQDKLLVLEVVPDHGSPSAYSNSFDPTAAAKKATPPVPTTPKDTGIRLAADGAAFVRLQVPKRSVYVGESIPIDIEVGARAGFVTQLNGLPTLNGGEFTLEKLSQQPERRETQIDGQPFVVLTWHTVIAAVKPGNFSLSVDTPLTVKLTKQPRQESALDNMLGDPFYQHLFGATVTKEVTITSPASDMPVLALPPGSPPDFTGAVGTFTVKSELSAPQGIVGDPLTLRMRIEGRGNFDRVDSRMIDNSAGWKSYPPTSTFNAYDKVGYRGEKTFEQPIIALQPGSQTLPGLNFSYFDPVAQRYETAHSEPLPLVVGSMETGQPASHTATPQPAVTMALRPDHQDADRHTQSLIPLYLRPAFLVLPPLLSLAFLAGWIARRPRRAAGAGAGAHGETRETKAIDAKLLAARTAGNTAAFLNVAHQAIREQLARSWKVASTDITAAEVQRRLGRDGADIADFFRLEDELRYAPRQSAPIDYERWRQVTLQTLRQFP